MPMSVVQGDDGSYGVFCTTGGAGILVELIANGDSVWEKNICNLGEEQASIFTVSKMNNGFIAGAKSSDTSLSRVVGVSSGSTPTTLFTWSPHVDFNVNFSVGNVIQTKDNGFFLAGYNNDWSKAMVIKTDASRQKLWSMNIDSLGYILMCQQTQDNGYVMIDGNNWIAKINNTGTMINFSTKITSLNPFTVCQISSADGYIVGGGWPKTYSNTGDYILSVRVTSDGNFVFLTNGGNFVKTNSNGDIIWNKQLSNNCSYMNMTTDGGFIISSQVGDWVMKTDENGDTN
jgi:hypothetical protein